MPTKFRIELHAQNKSEISGQTAAVRSKRQSGEWCSYPDFVENLGKPMNTAGEEAHHHTTGMAGEAGELLDITKKTWIYEKPLDVEHIIEEMGDLRWYYQSMLNMLGLTDEDIQAANTIKLLKRYPDGVYSNKAAIARADKVAGADRKFFGQPQKPAPEPVYDQKCSLTPVQQTQLREEMQRASQQRADQIERNLSDDNERAYDAVHGGMKSE